MARKCLNEVLEAAKAEGINVTSKEANTILDNLESIAKRKNKNIKSQSDLDMLLKEAIEMTKNAKIIAARRRNNALRNATIHAKLINKIRTSENPYDDVGGDAIGIQKAIKKFKDPAFSMKTLLGQASITTNDQGETVVIDRYNFNEENPDSFKDYAMKAARVASDPIYGSFREAGSIFGSDEGEGSFVRINLGKLL